MRPIRSALLRRGLAIALLLGAAATVPAAEVAAATITIVNLDGPNEGFNDPTPATPVGGNPGTTVGAQRLYVFNYAAGIWGSMLISSVEIRVGARFDPQTCDASSGVLGGASAGSSHRNFANAPYPDTWFQQALANKLAHTDLSASNDISITFNADIGGPNCLPAGWYYGVDGNEGTKIELLPVVLHELGHGLGFATITLAGVQMGTPPGPHVYDRFLYDRTLGLHWPDMTEAQRAASAQNCQNLVWDGPNVVGASAARLGPKPLLRVNSPPAIAGDYEVGLASFGPPLANPGVTGNLVLVNDGMGVPTNGCEPFLNAAQVAGNVALIDRGGCPFVQKAQNAQAAGAIAVVVADSMPGCPALGMSGVAPGVTIPTVRVTHDDGLLIKSQLLNGVNVSLRVDPTLDAGADPQGRVMVYTPIPFATGSSVSHWDISATPNLLMEPSLNPDLSTDVDLTIAQFTDIGWFIDPTATTLATFTAEGRADGILLRWQFTDPSEVRAVAVERGEATTGPWTSLAVEPAVEQGMVTALDAEAAPGRDHFYRLRVTDRAGQTETMGMVSARRQDRATAGVFLAAPRPNPMSRDAAVLFSLARPEYVRVAIVDAGGRRVRALHEGMLGPGEHQLAWDGRDDGRRDLPSGVYLVALTTSEGVQMRRVALTR